jgi:hypothetical protein
MQSPCLAAIGQSEVLKTVGRREVAGPEADDPHAICRLFASGYKCSTSSTLEKMLVLRLSKYLYSSIRLVGYLLLPLLDLSGNKKAPSFRRGRAFHETNVSMT